MLYSNPMPLADMHLFGTPATPSSTPSFAVSSYTEQMSLRERFFNWFNYFFYHYHLRDIFLGQTAKAFPPDVPHYTELMSQSQYVFVNMDEYLDFQRPVPFKYVNIGGVGMKKMGNSSKISDPVNACEICQLITFLAHSKSHRQCERRSSFGLVWLGKFIN